MRGKARLPDAVQLRQRITPACAGKSAHGECGQLQHQDHPRVCGEKCPRGVWTATAPGSPPRVRGKDPPGPVMRITGGITPACAGKSGHECREYVGHLGSPPRVRGKASKGRPPAGGGRITPACAGKRCRCQRHSRRSRNHPRVCGEKSRSGKQQQAGLGSPPRVRGKEWRQSLTARADRITPACAGKSFSWLLRQNVHRDHPRVCGEKNVLRLM